MIRLCDIRKTYKTRHGSVEVLNGISLTVPDHTLVMLLGESGSGKSTLCNILGLLDTPTAGEYYLDDTPIHTLSQKERTDLRREKVSFVFQSFNLIPTMTAWENIELPLGYRHFPKAERDARVETVLRSVGLIGRADHYPSELSGGGTAAYRHRAGTGHGAVSPHRGRTDWELGQKHDGDDHGDTAGSRTRQDDIHGHAQRRADCLCRCGAASETGRA